MTSKNKNDMSKISEQEVSTKERIEKRLFEISAKAIVLKDNKVLVLRRTGDGIRDAGKLDLPGGAIERGEKIVDSLAREIREELGIGVEIGPIVYFSDYEKEYILNKESGEKIKIYGKGVRSIAFYKEGKVMLSEENESYEWLDIDVAISRFNEKDEFESGKRKALIEASKYLQLQGSLDGWKRCMADFENYKKRQAESQKDLLRYSTQNIVQQILPVIDNFQASTAHIPEDQKSDPWVTGIMYIQKQLETVLSDNGVTEMETTVGDNFDPALHEAVEDKECNCDAKGKQNLSGQEEFKNKIKQVIVRGYMIGDKVVRPARVIVE